MTARVNVIMGVRDGGALLEPAVRSILAQTGVDLRLLIMDDGSTDGTAAALQRLAAEDPRIVLHHQENRGLGAALNCLIAADDAPYLARMDADDLSLPWRLQSQLAYMEAHPEVGVAGMWSLVKAPDEAEGHCSCYPDDHAWLLTQMERGWNVLVHSSVMMRRSALARLPGPYRFRYLQDFDLWLRVAGVARLGMVERVGHVSHNHVGRTSGRGRRARRRLHQAILGLHAERRRLGRESSDASALEAAILAESAGSEGGTLSAGWYRGMNAAQRGDFRLARRLFAGALLDPQQNRLLALKWLLALSCPLSLRLVPGLAPLLAFGRTLEGAAAPEDLAPIRAFLRDCQPAPDATAAVALGRRPS